MEMPWLEMWFFCSVMYDITEWIQHGDPVEVELIGIFSRVAARCDGVNDSSMLGKVGDGKLCLFLHLIECTLEQVVHHQQQQH